MARPTQVVLFHPDRKLTAEDPDSKRCVRYDDANGTGPRAFNMKTHSKGGGGKYINQKTSSNFRSAVWRTQRDS